MLIALILLLAAVLRVYQLDSSSLWSDEGNTWALLTRSFAQIAHDAAADIHPPGYYWLLKLWTLLFGTSAWGMRSFSAVAGVLLVYIIYRLGRYFRGEESLHSVALGAALLAAVNPLQIYYSQEARMYLLLALESAVLFWALYGLRRPTKGTLILPALGYLLSGIAGLWTHYSFPIVLAAAGVGFLISLAQSARATRDHPAPDQSDKAVCRSFWGFLGLNALMLLAYLPWLPIAIDRVLHWPKGGAIIEPMEGLRLTLHTLVFGPLRELPDLQWPWLLGTALLLLIGFIGQWRQTNLWPLALWFFAPILLMFGAGLFSDAFLKFLLTASPAWCLLVAVGLRHLPKQNVWLPLFLVGALALATLTLPAYYTSPTARDNYAGIAQYLQATATPERSLVVLDAPGQQEVWEYYNPGLPTLALPQQRPVDSVATLDALRAAVNGRDTIYALFWAVNEADPDQLVERWLDQQAFKGLDSWQGNLRFVTYTLPPTLHCTAVAPQLRFGEALWLTKLCQPNAPQAVTAGDVALVGLHWQSLALLSQRYNVTVQVLDSRNSVIAQRDSEPVGGSLPTDQWPVGETVVDNHGVLIPPGTPPGSYRLILAMYDPLTGERLRLPTAEDYLVLGELLVMRPQQPLPATLLPLQHPINQPLGPLHLIGYSAHRRGMAHAPDTPIVAGDVVEFTFFWQAPDPLPSPWPAELTFTLTLGDQSLTLPVAGEGYPSSQWLAGEVVRRKAELLYTGGTPVPSIWIGHEKLRLRLLPGSAWWHLYQ